MNYRSLFRTNPQDKKDPGKYYPYPVYEKTIGLNDFVKEISHATSLTPTDVRAAITEIVEIFHRYLVRGHKVKLNGVGTFKVSFKGDGAAKSEDLTASNIDRSTIKVTFVADAPLNQEMKNEVSFSKISEK
ncbi:MAG: HU family DNA-binding protein [Treponemataceae bacterium]|nr:HU family DNA-binding protein [Treponemataceae bacterium]